MATIVPLDLPLLTPAGEPTTLGDQLEKTFTIVQLVRYYGCLPCQDWAIDLDKRGRTLAGQGVGVMAIGGSADYQAEYLHDERGVGMPLLLDPAHLFRDAVGAKPLRLGLVDPRSAWSYVKRVKELKHQPVPTKDLAQSPGVVVLDQGGRVVWQHIGKFVGDYPELADVLTKVSDLR